MVSKTQAQKNKPVFNLFVEVGRVGYFNCGSDFGKLCTVIDIIDQNRVLVDGPYHTTGAPRKEANVKHINFLPIVVEGLKRGCSPTELKDAIMKQKIQEKWQQSREHQRMAQRNKRQHLNDFLRFKARILKKQRNGILRKEFSILKTEWNEKEQKRLAPHHRFLSNVEKKRKLNMKKSFQRLGRKILARHKGKNPLRTQKRIEEWKKLHPEAANSTTAVKPAVEKKKRTPNRARAVADRKAIRERKAAGEKKRAEKKLALKQKAKEQKNKVADVIKK